MPKTTYILVDFENVQPDSINPASGTRIKVFVFVGEKQTKLPIDLAISLQALGSNAEYIKVTGSSKNALDFHIAYWIGRLAEKDPKANFCIVSKDTGFDPLVKHLRKHKILARRVTMIAEIQSLNGTANGVPSEKITAVVKSLRLLGTSRPRKRKTLKNSISAIFMKTLPEAEIDELVSVLEKQGLISFAGDVVTYNLQEVNQPVEPPVCDESEKDC